MRLPVTVTREPSAPMSMMRRADSSLCMQNRSTSASTPRKKPRANRYRGYDLDRNGLGDVPHNPVRLFALVAEQHRPALILLRSPFVDLLDAAERLMPMLTPEGLADRNPLMRRPR